MQFTWSECKQRVALSSNQEVSNNVSPPSKGGEHPVHLGPTQPPVVGHIEGAEHGDEEVPGLDLVVGVHVDVDGMGGLVQLLSCSRSGLSEASAAWIAGSRGFNRFNSTAPMDLGRLCCYRQICAGHKWTRVKNSWGELLVHHRFQKILNKVQLSNYLLAQKSFIHKPLSQMYCFEFEQA